MDSNGDNQVKVATSKNTGDDYGPSGTIDISRFVGYEPASIFLANTMNCGSSMSVLINPKAKLIAQARASVSTERVVANPRVRAKDAV